MKPTKQLTIAAGLAAIVLNAIPTTKAAADESTVAGDAQTKVQLRRNQFNGKPDTDLVDTVVRGTVDYKISEQIGLRARGVAEASSVPNVDRRLQDGDQLGYEFSVDRADIRIKLKEIGLTLGETDNPFAPSIPQMDKDTPLVGAVVSTPIVEGVKIQFVYDAGRRLTDDTNSSMVGIQLLGDKKLENMTLTGNLGYQHGIAFDERYRLSNSHDLSTDILSAGGSVTLNDTFLGAVKGFVEYTHNFGMEENTDAAMTGIKIGETKEKGDISATFQYRYVGKDALLAGTTVRDSPGTNFDIWTIKVEGKVADNVTIYAANFNPKHIIPAGPKDNERQHVVEIGVEIKF